MTDKKFTDPAACRILKIEYVRRNSFLNYTHLEYKNLWRYNEFVWTQNIVVDDSPLYGAPDIFCVRVGLEKRMEFFWVRGCLVVVVVGDAIIQPSETTK